MSVTYQDLLDSGLPLAYFAKACKSTAIRCWKIRGIPEQHQPVLKKIFSKKIKDLKNNKKSSDDTANDTGKNQENLSKINHLPPQAAVNVAKNLGILPNNAPPLKINHLEWLNLPEISDTEMMAIESRQLRYIRQNSARYLQPQERVSDCLRKTTRIDVSVKRRVDGHSYFADLFVCGSIWRCPVCAAKISEKRRSEGATAIKQHRDKFGKNSVLFVTFTYPHGREDDLAVLVAKQKAAFQWIFRTSRYFRSFSEQFCMVGNIRALEITHSFNNGWHPHAHFLFFFERDFDFECDLDGFCISRITGIESIKKGFFDIWVDACERVGLGLPSWQHGVDVQDGSYASDYISKWGIEDEIFKSGLKRGRVGADGKASRSPFQLLDSFAQGDKQAGQLFQEYVKVFSGSAQQRWSKGLKARFNLADISDEQAAIGDDSGYLFALIPGADWAIIEKSSRGRYSEHRNILLRLSDLNDVQRFWAYVDWLCGRDVSARVFEPSPQQQLEVLEPEPVQLEVIEDFPVLDTPVLDVSDVSPSASALSQFHYQQQNSLFSFDDSRRVKPTAGLLPVQVLQDVFKYPAFRGVQLDVINHVMAGGSGLVLMPTGGGKSLCYQVPMLCRSGLGVVISPLIALMHDQVKALVDKGVKAVYLNSSLSEKRIFQVEQQILNGEVDILYISPERLNLSRTLKFLAAVELSMFAIDEAHCISQWGHDFRSDYLAVSVIQQHFPHVPRLALTATADSNTRADIVRLVGLEDSPKFTTSFDRPNIEYIVLSSKSNEQNKRLLLDYVTKSNGKTGIIYTSSRQKVNDLVELLQESGIDAIGYHAGMTPKQRKLSQDAFLSRSCVVVATTAFGMGIDKADVRYVLHFDLSDSIEAFYQESGRAGRDGLPSESVVIYNPLSVKSRIRHKSDSEQDKFEFVRKYCEIQPDSRRQYLLDFFI